MSKTRVIVNEFKDIVAKVNLALAAISFPKTVYYMYGHVKEINQRLQELSNSATEGDKKYPLICLFTDITVKKNIPGIYGSVNLQILIATLTEPTYTAEKRTEINFIPILHPIKEELINQIEIGKGFTYDNELKYEETDLYYYGSRINNKNIFNDYVDAIFIDNLQLNLTNIIC